MDYLSGARRAPQGPGLAAERSLIHGVIPAKAGIQFLPGKLPIR
jgi:hypothetical protein